MIGLARRAKTVTLFAACSLTLAACGGGDDGGDDDGGFAQPLPITISGKVNYEFVPPNANCFGLDFNSIETRPIRGATVQLIDADTGSVIDSTVSSDTGDYSFADVTASTDVRLRVRAELKRAGLPGWDVEVRDNFIAGASDADVPAPPPLATRALYVLDGSNFNTGGANVERDLLATTGWTGTAYTQPRAAAPFAILDAIYTAVQFVLTADADAAHQ